MVNPAKRLLGACLLDGGAQRAEDGVDPEGVGGLVQVVEIDDSLFDRLQSGGAPGRREAPAGEHDDPADRRVLREQLQALAAHETGGARQQD